MLSRRLHLVKGAPYSRPVHARDVMLRHQPLEDGVGLLFNLVLAVLAICMVVGAILVLMPR